MQQGQPQERVSIAFSGKSWILEMDSPGFVVQTKEKKADGREYLVAENPETHVVVSVTLEQAKGGADSKTCPGYLLKRMQSLAGLKPTDIKFSEIAQMATVEYLIPEASGVPLKQKNFVACTAKEDVYADIHLSKIQFQSSDESLFMNVLNRVHFTDRPAVETLNRPTSGEAPSTKPSGTSMDYFREGSQYFIAHDYQRSIAPYQAALDLEKKQPQLSKKYWRVLVDNLGMAYGITGDLDHSEEIYKYGLSKDPEYPAFYYSTACVYAERNNMDGAMDYLQKAFARKANNIPGESMPDPRKDDSFQRFMSNERFRKFVDSLVTSN
jgi:tetratricopeptide (TPR) repeat protein